MRLKKGDQVKIVSGKDRGKTGTVIRVSPDGDRLSVEGINVYKKRMRPKAQGKKGETVEVVRPLHASNVMLFCKNCKNPTRLGMRWEGNTKLRYCKKCQATI